MWGLHVINCLTLCFAPHVLYFYATDLWEHETTRPMLQGLLCSTINIFAKYILLATFLPAVDPGAGLHPKDLVYVVTALMDIIFMWFAIMRPFVRLHISNRHKAQAVALGWAFADSVVKRLVPILQGSSSENYLDQVFVAVKSNLVLAWSISFATVGALMWSRRTRSHRPGSLLAVQRTSVLLHALVPVALSLLERMQRVKAVEALGLHAGLTVVAGLTSYGLYSSG